MESAARRRGQTEAGTYGGTPLVKIIKKKKNCRGIFSEMPGRKFGKLLLKSAFCDTILRLDVR